MAELIVALDLASGRSALSLVDRLGDAVDFYKVGSPLFTRAGPSILRQLRERGKRIFLDLKFHDIPNTVGRAVDSAADLGVELLTVHTSGGSAMLRAAREAAGTDGPRLLGVTLLTSLSAAEVEEAWAKELRSMREEVNRLAGLAADAGLDGVVASGLEVEALKRRHGPAFLVATPGIRPASTETADHFRSATPLHAVRAGSDYLVVGRPVFEARDPVAATATILEEMGAVQAGGA